MKFRILLNMPKFPIAKQARIIVACMAIHNFIRESKLADTDFDMCDNDENYAPLDFEDDFELDSDEEEYYFPEDSNMNAFLKQLMRCLMENKLVCTCINRLYLFWQINLYGHFKLSCVYGHLKTNVSTLGIVVAAAVGDVSLAA